MGVVFRTKCNDSRSRDVRKRDILRACSCLATTCRKLNKTKKISILLDALACDCESEHFFLISKNISPEKLDNFDLSFLFVPYFIVNTRMVF